MGYIIFNSFRPAGLAAHLRRTYLDHEKHRFNDGIYQSWVIAHALGMNIDFGQAIGYEELIKGDFTIQPNTSVLPFTSAT